MMVEINQPAPDFSLPASDGTICTLSELRGKHVVLYFYPKDDTSGCTKQAQSFSEHQAAFQAVNTVVLGVSKDSLSSHEKFIAKYNLTITLLADEACTLCEQYGTWVEKSMYGKKYMGIERATFLIDASGKVQQIWRKVKVPGHVEEVLQAAQALG